MDNADAATYSHAPDKVEEGLDTTLEELGLEYLDLYLMHWPVGNHPKTGDLEYDYVSVRLYLPHPLHSIAKTWI
jgi:diketogulonate reductase-like aldo/keto reductase